MTYAIELTEYCGQYVDPNYFHIQQPCFVSKTQRRIWCFPNGHLQIGDYTCLTLCNFDRHAVTTSMGVIGNTARLFPWHSKLTDLESQTTRRPAGMVARLFHDYKVYETRFTTDDEFRPTKSLYPIQLDLQAVHLPRRQDTSRSWTNRTDFLSTIKPLIYFTALFYERSANSFAIWRRIVTYIAKLVHNALFVNWQ